MQAPKISVIIPMYNSAHTLTQCLESIAKQSFKKLEILCVDAYSDDDTDAILEKFAKKDHRFIILKSPQKSLGAQINLGLAQAKGEYFCIVESDDYTYPQMCEILYSLAQEKQCDIIKADISTFKQGLFGYSFTYKELAYKKELYGKVLFPQENLAPFLYSWNMNQSSLYKLDFVRKFKLKANESLGASYQDTGLWILLLSFAKTLYFHNQALYFYRTDNKNSSTKNKEKVFCVCDEFAFAYNFLNSHKRLEKNLQEALNYKQFAVYWWNFKRIAKPFKQEFALRFAKEFQEKYKLGQINESYFTSNELKILKELLQDPIYFTQKWLSLNFKARKKLARYKNKIFRFLKLKK